MPTPIRLAPCLALAACTAVFADDALVPAYVIDLPESVADVFIADTGASRIYHFEHSEGGIRLERESYISIGENGVGKEKAWDGRTPLGIYFVIDQLDTSKLHEKYGVTAFPLDYPNTWDRRRARSGDGIWVHGVLPNGGQRPPLDTDGCIALPNADLSELEDRFVPLVTPVIVTREMRWHDAATVAALREELRQAVDEWARRYADADLHGYLSMYSGEFRYRGMPLSEWASLRVQTLSARGPASVEIEDLVLLEDPEEPGLYLSRFTERVAPAGSDDSLAPMMKRLYWRRGADGGLRIVAEDNG